MDPLSLSARDLSAALRHRRVSAREVLQAHFARIDEVNPSVNAVVTQVRERAYEQALAADDRAAATAPEDLPPLHGIPMTHKDTHATAGIRTTSGSPVFGDLVPRESDLVIERFQRAGVISTGKNNVPEFAAGSHTYNTVFGTTRNPYDPSRSAGGSSGGAAVTLATRIQPLADGSDMGGSLRNPAAFNNVVGFRASHGVVPNAPARDPRAWLGQKGAMARSVEDVILAMSVLAGPDARVPVPCPTPAGDFAELLAESVGQARHTTTPDHPLAGVRVAVTTDFGLGVPVEGAVAGVVREEAEVFADLGATVEEACPRLREADRVFDATRAFDMALALRDVVAGFPGQVKEEVIWNVERGLALTAADLMDVAIARGRLDREIARFFGTGGTAGTAVGTGRDGAAGSAGVGAFDVLLAPTAQLVPFPAEWAWPREVAGVAMGSYVDWMRSATLISATGCPAISVPGGFTAAGLPVGLQLVGAPGRDVDLLRVARAYDEATRYADRAPAI
ncbi:amidase family protein [Citricoccus sp. K5]|uniref:amidase family protein n=1 Tax=Citricoccus sp. K5 TaxID=2653135 RepID=UPI0012F3FD40|nr:amidase family protein [Citricoccus sp. K5]VXB59168.1 Amidase [Citricoccus sp. K5]